MGCPRLLRGHHGLTPEADPARSSSVRPSTGGVSATAVATEGQSWLSATEARGPPPPRGEIDYGYPLANIGFVSSTKLNAIPKRSYRSERRERQARETRKRILAVASAEFERRGYVATPMRAVAEAAGVSVPTVELVFGTKSELLRAAISFAIRGDAEPVPMLKRPWAQRAQEASSVADFLAIVGRVLVEGQQRSARLILAAFEAANHDESMSALADQLRGQRAETAAWLVDETDRTRFASRRDHTGAGDRHDLAADGSPRIHCPDSRPRLDRRAVRGVVHRQRQDAPFGGRVRTTGSNDALAFVAADYIHIEAEDIMSEHANQPAAAGDEHSVDTGLARPGAVTYLHMPATDVRRAAAFYRDVFAWSINRPDSDRPSFDDASGLLSGAWISDHLPAAEPGLLPYIYVADIEQTVALIVAHGGAILTEPYPEGLLTVATFRDPAGNVIGLWHDTTRSPATAEQSGAPATEQPVPPVPEHLHTVTPRLALTDAAAAIDFYAKAFDAREVGERHCAPDGTLIHAELRIGDSIVMVTEDQGYTALLVLRSVWG